MKKIKFFEKPAGARTVYIMAGVSFCLAAIAVGIVYSKTINAVEENLTMTKTTYQVGLNQQGETDPRITENTSAKVTENTTAATTSEIYITTKPIAEVT